MALRPQQRTGLKRCLQRRFRSDGVGAPPWTGTAPCTWIGWPTGSIGVTGSVRHRRGGVGWDAPQRASVAGAAIGRLARRREERQRAARRSLRAWILAGWAAASRIIPPWLMPGARPERRGHVALHSDPADRRRVLVRARSETPGRIAAIGRPMRGEMERLCARYTEAEPAVLMGIADRSAGIPRAFVQSLSAGRSGASQAS